VVVAAVRRVAKALLAPTVEAGVALAPQDFRHASLRRQSWVAALKLLLGPVGMGEREGRLTQQTVFREQVERQPVSESFAVRVGA
jgi:hypothetical protein